MKSLLRRRPTPALVISLLALFISLSGVSYGVATGFIDSREIKNNEIRSLDIRDNQIRSRDIRNNEVRGIDIRNSTVQSRDIAINAVRGEDVKEDTLAKVPSALLADSATSADAVGGVTMRKIAYSAGTGSGFVGRIFKNVNGTWTQISPAPDIVAQGGNGVLRFETLGPSLKLFLDDGVTNKLIAFANDVSFAGPGLIGLRSSAGATFDNYNANVIANTTTTLPFQDPFNATTNLVTGVDYHHISNALGRDNERNPSQNEARLWIGLEWIF